MRCGEHGVQQVRVFWAEGLEGTSSSAKPVADWGFLVAEVSIAAQRAEVDASDWTSVFRKSPRSARVPCDERGASKVADRTVGLSRVAGSPPAAEKAMGRVLTTTGRRDDDAARSQSREGRRDRWKNIFDAQAAAGAAAGLTVKHVWRSVDAADEVFFLLDIEDRARAEADMAAPEASAVGVDAGVLDGDIHFLEAFPPSGA